MDSGDQAGNDLVFLVHLSPFLLNFWENLEVPNLLISERSERI